MTVGAIGDVLLASMQLALGAFMVVEGLRNAVNPQRAAETGSLMMSTCAGWMLAAGTPSP